MPFMASARSGLANSMAAAVVSFAQTCSIHFRQRSTSSAVLPFRSGQGGSVADSG
jgi:hypothetical protein